MTVDPAAPVRGRDGDRPRAHARDLELAVPALDRLEPCRRARRGTERHAECDGSDEAAHAATVPQAAHFHRLAEMSPSNQRTARFDGKRALVLGVANKRSIAWAIARRLADEGAELAFTFQGERIEGNVRELASTVGSKLVTPCDVRADEDLERVFGEVADLWDGRLDLLVHSVAFAAAEDLEGRFTDTPRDRFWLAVDISAYSLVAAARAAEPLMAAAGGGSIVTMTYLGGERAVPHYNVMGVAKATLDASVKYLAWDLGEQEIRVNAISAGPVRTLAARSIAGFTQMESMFVERAPLRRHIDADDVAAASAYLLSDDAKNVTGTTLYVDSGYHAMGM